MMAKLPTVYTFTPLPDDFGFGPEDKAIQDDAAPDTLDKLAAIIRRFDGSNERELAQQVCNLVFEGEPING